MENVIECNNITHYYGSRLVYRDLCFTVPRGKIMGLLGKNGTGKTTIINILNGFLKPTKGNCKIFGEDVQNMSPAVKAKIGLQLEGHVQHHYMNAYQIENFYSRFYPYWNSDAYFRIVQKLKIQPTQPLSTMSCGQRSQVALGLLFAQNPELLVLDDFSMGLDPGYRRLFIENLREYVKDGTKTVFLTSHIIQDMEKLVDDCIVFDYGKMLLHKPTSEILLTFRRFSFRTLLPVRASDILINPERRGDTWEVYSFAPTSKVIEALSPCEVWDLKEERLTLEDAFIGLTGKY